MNRIFEDTLTRGKDREDDALAGTWVPPVDIIETRDKLVMKAELPGFTEDQIQVRFQDGVLSIEGERKLEKESDEDKYHCVERSYGRFLRSFRLPASVAHERISASYVNGVLSVELPKREETRPKSIKVHSAQSSPPIDVKKG